MTQTKSDFLEKAYTLGVKYEKKCTGCAQTAIAAIFDTLGIWNEEVFMAASGLADGLGLTGDGSCGALIGSSMVIGYLFGRKKEGFSDMTKAMKSYSLVKQLHDDYIEKYGTCRCHDVQKSTIGKTFNLWNPKELKSAMKSGMLENCSEVVGNTAKMATDIILSNGFKPIQK
jgi:C_GCAxxG_C_C family probable redox protein